MRLVASVAIGVELFQRRDGMLIAHGPTRGVLWLLEVGVGFENELLT